MDGAQKITAERMIEKLFVEREDMHLYAHYSRKNISAGFIDANGRRNIDVSIYNNRKNIVILKLLEYVNLKTGKM